MHANDNEYSRKWLKILFYGVSATSVRCDIDSITGLQAGNKAIRSEETGMVSTGSEVFGGGGGQDCYCGGGGGGEGELICCLIAIVLLAVFAIVWTIVMIAYAIMTFGGFVRRRFRTQLVIENENPEFIGKLAVLTFKKGGVAKYEFGSQPYDSWVSKTFGMFNRTKYIRQVSIFFAFIWGSVEVLFKIYQYFFNPLFNYDLWPFRYVMVAIFVPLLLYSPFLELTIRGLFEEGG
ncbi:MAG: hypothetical protein ACFFF4_13840, partial [Candidatus Thorarchaeota archaeon]